MSSGSRKETKGLLMCFTGNGKGKTTAALGSLMRAYGRGLKVVMLQFIKKAGAEFGEHITAKKLGVEVIPLGDGFTWKSEDIMRDQKYARDCWNICKNKILSGEYDMVILDEITYPLIFNWLDTNEVLDVIRQRPEWVHVIITGRNANDQIIEAADMVTEMMEIKHHYRNKVPQQFGVEY